MKAVFKKASASLAQANLHRISSPDEDGCTDPASDDAEAAEGECFDEIKKQCDADGVSETDGVQY